MAKKTKDDSKSGIDKNIPYTARQRMLMEEENDNI